ncbi:glycosyl hydrolase-related protein [Paenibacillus sp. J5C_2022]|uniref:DUF7402 domain-containing protein n=1 Tax=Paenibacillus sp. J5C2022 TaxID=2977129 RepID=UPI0021D2CEB3|nr:discoidin domain-containing protein [Paenibacillus sp. J5C2022]MCU6708059.1 glycosyl hydrolase-related protein [Paenibacillus sp. J5C2022]
MSSRRAKTALTVVSAMLVTVFVFLAVQIVHAATTITNITQTPWIIDDSGTLKSETRLTVTNTDSPYDGWVKISVAGLTPYMESIGTVGNGVNQVTVRVAELINDNDNVTFQVYDNSGGTGTPKVSVTLPQKKIRHWKVYVAHDMHTDIGYTDYQETLRLNTFPGFLDTALNLADDTSAWGDDDKFRYPVEASYMLYDSALKARDADWIERLKTHAANGRITYPYSYANFATEGMGTEQMARQMYYSARHLKDTLGTDPKKVYVHTDDTGFSWANVDALVQAGAKYVSLRFNDSYWNYFEGHNPYYPRIFYLNGMVSGNKVLVHDGPKYDTDDFKFRNANSNETFEAISSKMVNRQEADYPYDALLLQLTNNRDNDPIEPNVKDNVKAMNERVDSMGRPYVYPQFRNSDIEDFFTYVESNYDSHIPAFQGTMENLWNFGSAQQSEMIALSKENHEKVPAAEFYSTIANIASSNARYPYEELSRAYNDMMLTDEHTWAAMTYYPDDIQIKWKRNKAIEASRIADQTLGNAFAAINSQIPTSGKTIVVYNNLSWVRSDIVKVKQVDLPEYFDIKDKLTGQTIKYQKTPDGDVVFQASDVPQYGYKTFEVVTRVDDPVFSSSVTATANTIENSYFKVTFDETGAIVSILDKQNGNREMVDHSAPYKMNEFLYFTAHNNSNLSHGVKEAYRVEAASAVSDIGGIRGTFTSTASAMGADNLQRSVILYDAIPRIDIVNEFLQQDSFLSYQNNYEDMFFSFPFAVDDFMIKHGTPTGPIRPYVDPNIHNPTDQIYYSTTDFYTVNHWIDISNQENYGIDFAPINAPMVQYGERRTMSHDKDYNTQQPWVYSWVYNNEWLTNYSMSQPGNRSYRYAIRSHTGSDWQSGRADKFGLEQANELRASVISGAQSGTFSAAGGEFLNISEDNVVLTTQKIAEANGEGMILRFIETNGEDTTVTIDFSGYLIPSEVYETDLVENDLAQMSLVNDKVTFEIKGHGWKTLRLKRGYAPDQVTGLTAVADSDGTLVAWDELNEPTLSYYEVFRGTNANFVPGAGTYVASVNRNVFYDQQVTSGLTNDYYYKVRAVSFGKKGASSSSAQALGGVIADAAAPTAPSDLTAEALSPNWVTLSWDASYDDLLGVKGYKIYRDGNEIADVSSVFNSYLDVILTADTAYQYYVKAYDEAINLSAQSNTVSVTTLAPWRTGNIAPLATFTASSTLGSDGPEKAADGIITIQGTGEWVSHAELNPWIRLDWPTKREIGKIVLVDRSNHTDNARDGVLTFSDGSSIEVNGIDIFGRPKEVVFDTKNVSWVRFDATNGQGYNVGLSEILVFESNPARRAAVTASSEQGYLPPILATDGIIGTHNSGEWASNETNPWIRLDLIGGQKINRVVLYDRVNMLDNARSGTLTFSDGSSVSVSGIPDDGTAKEVVFDSRTVTWVKFEVTGGTGPRVGLSEIQLFDDNLARHATVTASSQFSAGHTPEKAADGIIGEHDNGEWGALGESNPWIQFNWTTRKIIDRIVLYDRINGQDDANGGVLTFSDGSSLTVDGIPWDGKAKEIRFLPKAVTWVKFEATGGTGVNVGLSEVQIYDANALSGAKITASSNSVNLLPAMVADGVVGTANSGEWASLGEQNPWLRFDFTQVSPRPINRIVIYDRPGNDDANSGILTFSDGSSMEVSGIPGDGSPKLVHFPTKHVYWMKFQITGGVGPNVGINEIEAYDVNLAYNAEATVSSEHASNKKYGYKLNDGIIGWDNEGEWSSTETNPWARLDWGNPVTVRRVVLYDRWHPNDNARSGILSFSDGTSISVTGIPDDGEEKVVTFDAKTVSWIKFQTTGGVGGYVGLSEIQVFEHID